MKPNCSPLRSILNRFSMDSLFYGTTARHYGGNKS